MTDYKGIVNEVLKNDFKHITAVLIYENELPSVFVHPPYADTKTLFFEVSQGLKNIMENIINFEMNKIHEVPVYVGKKLVLAYFMRIDPLKTVVIVSDTREKDNLEIRFEKILNEIKNRIT
ncbi:hypothetical protein [Persephonella sp.]